MGLISNGHRNAFTPFKWSNGALLSIQNGGHFMGNGYLTGKLQNGSVHFERQSAFPNGNLHPYGWVLPRVAGGMSMRTEASGTISAVLVPSIAGSIDFTGQGGFSAEAALVISMLCQMAGEGTLDANIFGLLDMSVDLEGQGDLEANLFGIANMLADLTGSGDLESVIAAYGDMSIDIVVTGTGLSTANVGQAVWEAVISQFASNPESAAAKLLAAGSAGDPWSTNLPASYTGTQAGMILSEISRLVERLHRIQGLDPDNPSTTDLNTRTWTAGDITIDMTGDLQNETTMTARP